MQTAVHITLESARPILYLATSHQPHGSMSAACCLPATSLDEAFSTLLCSLPDTATFSLFVTSWTPANQNPLRCELLEQISHRVTQHFDHARVHTTAWDAPHALIRLDTDRLGPTLRMSPSHVLNFAADLRLEIASGLGQITTAILHNRHIVTTPRKGNP